MAKKDKLLDKFLEKPVRSDLKWSEVVTLLKNLGFTRLEGSGSRIKFVKNKQILIFHKPHPKNTINQATVRDIQSFLKKHTGRK